ncbi:putative tRNA pseudouridine synthase D [Candidatus Tiddalikarchaeum anstoanum]|nr:putative tRNA pseudouridine synthase D [Candidatus Tiddalikarchaeum anstoanum]
MYRKFPINYIDIGIKTKTFKESTKGYIKEKPEDFIVEEIPFLKKKNENGNLTYFTLTKKNWTTTQAINKIARYCHVSWKRFNFAGTKDRFGITKQLVSVKGVNPEFLETIKIKDITISDIFKSDEPLKLGDLQTNNFIITVRDYECKNVKSVIEHFIETAKQGLPNYFGEQRFGLQRPNNHLVGKYILKEDFDNALKQLLAVTTPMEGEESGKVRKFLFEHWGSWKEALEIFPKYLTPERVILNHLVLHKNDYVNALRRLPRNIAKIFVYSYQSYIFNLAVSKMVEKGLISDFEIELPGYDSTLKKLGGSIIEEVLKDEGLKLSDFRVSSYPEISCRGTTRRTLVFPDNFKIVNISGDSYTVSFSLPKASYATIIMRELIAP